MPLIVRVRRTAAESRQVSGVRLVRGTSTEAPEASAGVPAQRQVGKQILETI